MYMNNKIVLDCFHGGEIVVHADTPHPASTCSFIMRIDKADEILQLLTQLQQTVECYVQLESMRQQKLQNEYPKDFIRI